MFSIVISVLIMMFSCERLSNEWDEVFLRCGIRNSKVVAGDTVAYRFIDPSGNPIQRRNLDRAEWNGQLLHLSEEAACVEVPAGSEGLLTAVSSARKLAYSSRRHDIVRANRVVDVRLSSISNPTLALKCAENDVSVQGLFPITLFVSGEGISPGSLLQTGLERIDKPSDRSLFREMTVGDSVDIIDVVGEADLHETISEGVFRSWVRVVLPDGREKTINTADTCRFTIDRTPPEIAVDGLRDNMPVSQNSEVSIVMNEKGNIRFRLSLDGETLKEGDFFDLRQVIAKVPDGPAKLSFIGIDRAGNQSEASRNIIIDTTIPTLHVKIDETHTEATDFSIRPDTPIVFSSSEPGSIWGCERRDDERKPCASTIGFVKIRDHVTFHKEGTYEVIAYAEDLAGNRSAKGTYRIVVDNTGPEFQVLDTIPKDVTVGEQFTIPLSEEPSDIRCEVVKDGTFAKFYRDNPCEYIGNRQIVLTKPGHWALRFIAIDSVGNVSKSTTAIIKAFPRPVFLERCLNSNPEAVALKQSIGGTSCEDAWSRIQNEVRNTRAFTLRQGTSLVDLSGLRNLEVVDSFCSSPNGLEGLLNIGRLVLYSGTGCDEGINPRPTKVECSSLLGLRYVSYLEIEGFHLADPDCIALLPSLVFLKLTETDLAYASFLNLKPIKTLNLSKNNLVEFSHIVLPELRELNLSNNRIRGISGVSNSNQLERLILDNNELTDLDPVGNLHTLKELSVNRNRLNSISALVGLSNLEQLSLKENPQSENFPYNTIPKLVSLRTLDLSSMGLKSIPDLSQLDHLEVFIALSNSLVSLEGIGAKNLKEARIGSNVLLDVKDLTDALKLKTLEIHVSDYFDNISGLSMMDSLENLEIVGGAFKSVDDLLRVKNLKNVRLYSNEVSSVDGLFEHPSLETIDIGGSQVKKITVAKDNKSKVTKLGITLGKLDDTRDGIGTLSHLTTLEVLSLRNNGLSNLDIIENIIANLPKLYGLDISFNKYSMGISILPSESIQCILEIRYNKITDVCEVNRLKNRFSGSRCSVFTEGNPGHIAAGPSFSDMKECP